MLMSSTCMLLSQLWSPLMQCIILPPFFNTGDEFRTHCFLYDKAAWPSLSVRREQHCMIFIHKALLHVLPDYFTSLISFRTCNLHTCSQESLILNIPTVKDQIAEECFSGMIYWNDLQRALELDRLISPNAYSSVFCSLSVIVSYDHIVYVYSCVL